MEPKFRPSKFEASFENRHLSASVSCMDFRGLQHHHMKTGEGANSKSPTIHHTVELQPKSDTEDEEKGGKGKNFGFVTVPTLNGMPYLATIFAAQECTQSIRDQRRWILSLPVSLAGGRCVLN